MTSIRSDAAARRALLLDAADAVFGEHGITAPLDLVVERAGVGRATLYRNFPDRTALVEALLQRTVETIEAHLQQLGERDDALFELIEGMARRIVHSPALADYWRAVDRDAPAIKAAREHILNLSAPALQRAKAAGLCRPDLELADISLISSMLGAALRGRTAEDRAALARRALELLRPGLSAPLATDRK
ncbi:MULTISPECIES: TetR/AcrR family transcriptional regulator [Stenotrophomonas]|uniref:TetR/AcrR family transcriptional regulator n=1 Tax=Stenotrophomonas TaxID=40323 RepID=UPI0007706C11|nr:MULTISPECIES: TetR/AcrR family transcriptional regulator [Stenotrophomonas]AMJ55818.1 TetR family transcriptional regulator [Stenotrophomonas sp. KCTC 12332]